MDKFITIVPKGGIRSQASKAPRQSQAALKESVSDRKSASNFIESFSSSKSNTQCIKESTISRGRIGRDEFLSPGSLIPGIDIDDQIKSKVNSFAVTNAKTETKKRKQSQMLLDFGQKSIGKRNSCNICGMLYVIGDDDDEKRHNAFCKKFQNGVCFPSISQHKTLTTYEDGTVIRFNMDYKQHHSILQRVMAEVENDLGTTESFVEKYGSALFLYVHGDKLNTVGLMLAEEISSAHCVILKENSDISKIFTPILQVDEAAGSSSHSDRNVLNHSLMLPKSSSEAIKNMNIAAIGSVESANKVLLGVRLIWSRSCHRRQMIATKLLDTARKHFYYSKVISIEDLAFSQPTSSGLKFALKYSNKETIYGYA